MRMIPTSCCSVEWLENLRAAHSTWIHLNINTSTAPRQVAGPRAIATMDGSIHGTNRWLRGHPKAPVANVISESS